MVEIDTLQTDDRFEYKEFEANVNFEYLARTREEADRIADAIASAVKEITGGYAWVADGDKYRTPIETNVEDAQNGITDKYEEILAERVKKAAKGVVAFVEAHKEQIKADPYKRLEVETEDVSLSLEYDGFDDKWWLQQSDVFVKFDVSDIALKDDVAEDDLSDYITLGDSEESKAIYAVYEEAVAAYKAEHAE